MWLPYDLSLALFPLSLCPHSLPLFLSGCHQFISQSRHMNQKWAGPHRGTRTFIFAGSLLGLWLWLWFGACFGSCACTSLILQLIYASKHHEAYELHSQCQHAALRHRIVNRFWFNPFCVACHSAESAARCQLGLQVRPTYVCGKKKHLCFSYFLKGFIEGLLIY